MQSLNWSENANDAPSTLKLIGFIGRQYARMSLVMKVPSINVELQMVQMYEALGPGMHTGHTAQRVANKLDKTEPVRATGSSLGLADGREYFQSDSSSVSERLRLFLFSFFSSIRSI